MAGLAAIEKISAKTEPNAAKPRRISKRLRQAIDLLVTGECKTQKAAAERLKLAPETLSRALREHHVLSYIEQQTRVVLSRSQAPAAATLIRLATDAASEHVQKDAAIHLLAMAGHKPKADAQVSVNIDIKAGYVIDLTEDARVVNAVPQRIAGSDHKTQVIDNAEE
jgi:hypothetical protein